MTDLRKMNSVQCKKWKLTKIHSIRVNRKNVVFFTKKKMTKIVLWYDFSSLRVCGLLSSSLLLFPQCFGRYVLRPSSGVFRLNFRDEAWWFLSLRVSGLLFSSLLLFPQRFGRYVLRSSSGVCRLNFWDKACWFLSLRVFALLSLSLLLYPQRFGQPNKLSRNVVKITIKMKTTVQKPLMKKIPKLRLRNLDKWYDFFSLFSWIWNSNHDCSDYKPR